MLETINIWVVKGLLTDFLSVSGPLGFSRGQKKGEQRKKYQKLPCGSILFLLVFKDHFLGSGLNLYIPSFQLGEAMATHSSTLAWKTPWTEEPGRLRSLGSWRVRHDWATSLSRIGEGNGSPLQCSCLENPRDGGARWGTWLKWLSSSSGSFSIWKGY